MRFFRPVVKCLLFLSVFCWQTAQSSTFSLVRLEVGSIRDPNVARLLALDLDITCYDPRTGVMEAIVSSEQKQAVSRLGFFPIEVIEDISLFTEQLRESGYFERFHTYEQMRDEMQAIVDSHADIAALYDIGDSYNKTFGRGGYDILALKISDDVEIEDPDEAEALFMANVHAREIITPEIILFFMHYLIDNYGGDPYVTHLVDNREIWLIPTVNPDGHEYVFSGDIRATDSYDTTEPVWWRKNMRDNDFDTIFDPRRDGVDLNRNFGFRWGYDSSGSSGFPSSETYRGPEPFSEPETQAVRDIVIKHEFVVSLSYHSYLRSWLYPWGYAALDPPAGDLSTFRALADSCVAYNGYLAGNYKSGAIWYDANGESDDWLYGEMGIFAFTPEVGNSQQGGFWPDTSFIEQQVLENLGPNLYMAYAAGEEPLVECERIADYEEPPDSIIVNSRIRPPVRLTDAVPLDESSFHVYYRTDKNAPFDSVQMSSTGSDGLCSAVLEAHELQGTVYYYVGASDEIGRTGTSPRGGPAAADSFYVKADTTAQTPVAERGAVSGSYRLEQNYPNPFNPETRIRFTLPRTVAVKLMVYDMKGRRVRMLSDRHMESGDHSVLWDGTDDDGRIVPTGIYFYLIKTEDYTGIGKMTLIR